MLIEEILSLIWNNWNSNLETLDNFIDEIKSARIDVWNIYTGLKEYILILEQNKTDLNIDLQDWIEIANSKNSKEKNNFLEKKNGLLKNIKKFESCFVYHMSNLWDEPKIIEIINSVRIKISRLVDIIDDIDSLKRLINSKFFKIIDIELWWLWVILQDMESYKENLKTRLEQIKKQVTDQTIALKDQLMIDRVKEIILNNHIEIKWQWIYEISIDSAHNIGNISKKLVEYEILARIKIEQWEEYSPEQLFELIKSTSYLSLFDWCVLEKAFYSISKLWFDCSFGININPVTFKDEQFLEKIDRLVSTYWIDPNKVIIEVLESEIVEHPSKIDLIFWELRKRGFRIAIDDFPKWYNSLYHIIHLTNLDIVKIDGKHILDMYTHCESCESIIDCSNKLETNIIPEMSCLKRENVGADLESLIYLLAFIKLIYVDIEFIAERVENEHVYEFLRKIWFIKWYQWFWLSHPESFNIDNWSFGWFNISKEIIDKPVDLDHELKRVSDRIKDIIWKSELGVLISEFLGKLPRFRAWLVFIEKYWMKEDITGNSVSSKFIEALKDIFDFMEITLIRFYLIKWDNIWIKKINKDWVIEIQTVDLAKDVNVVPLSYRNFYNLYYWRNCIEVFGYKISNEPTPWGWDDATIKISDELFIWIDDQNSALKITNEVMLSYFVELWMRIWSLMKVN